jgi:hypothetical protein
MMKTGNTTYKAAIRIALATGFLLLLPLLAMQFTNEVVWDVADFIVAGVLLFGTGLTYKLAAIKVGNIVYRSAVGFAFTAAFILIWVNGAVGIIGSENNDANLMYGGVIGVFVLNAFFVMLWVGSALLFRNATREQPPA